MRRIVHLFSLRNLIPGLGLVLFVNIVGYLLLATPVSKQNGKKTFSEREAFVTQDEKLSTFRKAESMVGDGYGAWIPHRSIEIMSAIHDLHHLDKSETRFVLLGFLRHSSERNFVCCFHKSFDLSKVEEVPAELDYIDLRFIVDLQNAVFSCVLKSPNRSGNIYKYVSLATETCSQNTSSLIEIVYPVPRSWELAVCTKLAYGKLDPVRLVEWFEYMKLVGVSKVLTFYNNLHPVSLNVFNYYTGTGLLELISYKSRSIQGYQEVNYTDGNAQTRQARQDKTLLVRDCQYRLGGYDYVMTIDFDELPVPIRPYGTINWVIMEMLLNYPDASGFRMDPFLMPPEWAKPKSGSGSGLYHWQFTSGTYIAPYCHKWVYLPKHTWLAATHENIPKKGYKTYVLPSTHLHFLHFRSCKSEWHDIPCFNLSETVKNERVLERFGNAMYDSLRKLPLRDLVPNTKYVDYVRKYKNSASMPATEDDSLEMLLQ